MELIVNGQAEGEDQGDDGGRKGRGRSGSAREVRADRNQSKII